MPDEGHDARALPPLVWIAGIPTIGGLVLQSVLAPDTPAWGFYEVFGFVVAAVAAATYGLIKLVKRAFGER